MKPVAQLFSLVLEKMWLNSKKISKIKNFKTEVDSLRASLDPDKFETKLEQLKTKEVKALLFDNYLRVTNNAKLGVQSMKLFLIKQP